MSIVKVLLIEDNSDDEFLALRTLKKMGFFDVKVARDGREAINMLLGDESAGLPPQIDPPSFMLLDLRLPKLDGLEVLRKLRSSGRTSGVPVYVLTSSEDPHDKEVCKNLGVIAFLPKPLTVDVFQSVLQSSAG
ncbi:response regulator MprA [Geobacter sp. OR-1]|uniref:response regulator n=1 Tax=Geobacter sp. OR-1 TaxID=1266765 RepID=UPI000543F171|nr:response regulator [Geobacter sp. OR-1]GAM08473.1 response regulator MprA [Geobacter sp. OR-1]